MKNEFKAIETIKAVLDGLSIQEANRVLNYVQNINYDRMERPVQALGQAPQTEMELPVEEKKAPVKKKSSVKKKAPKKAKEPVVVPTLEEVQGLCRDVATKLKSADKVKALIQECCGVGSLGEVTDQACFIDLAKKLKDA